MTRAIAALAMLLTAACGGTGPSDNGGVANVVIDGTATLTMIVSDTRQLAATANDADGTPVVGAPLVWSSNNTAVATVTTAGLVTALAEGSARIIARSGSRADTVSITVVASGVANVIVTIPRALLKVSDTVRAEVRAVDATGATVTGRQATWHSSNGDAAVVTPFGLVLGVAPANPVTISATIDGHTGSTTIAIIKADIGAVIVSPDTVIMAPGKSVQLQVSVTDEFGFDASDRQVTWSSFNEPAAIVDQTGMVTSIALGESTISATVDGVIGQALVRVLAVDTDTYKIEVTNYLAYPIEVLENGNSVGQVGAMSTGAINRPLRASFQFGWAVVRPANPGEAFGATEAPIADPTGTIHFDVDNVLDDGRVYYTPYIRNLDPGKAFLDPLPKLEAGPCQCPVSPYVNENHDLGYWLLNGTSVLRFFAITDLALANPLLTVPVPVGSVEARSGIYRYTLTGLP